MNDLFNELNNAQNPMVQFQTFMQNPAQFLLRKQINIPQQYMNDPKSATQYLINNGQMSQAQLSWLSQMAQMMGFRL